MRNGSLTFEQWYVKSSYQDFVNREGVPLYEGSNLENMLSLPLADWERRGGKAAYTRLGDQELYALQIVEIPPKGELKPEHHVYDAVMFVMRGRGASTVWQSGEPKHTVEWQEGSLLAIPLNAWHQEFNSSADEPCRVIFATNMSYVINFYHNLEFIFNCPFVFTDRYSHAMHGYFGDDGIHWTDRLFETNFIPDVRTLNLDPDPHRGEGVWKMRLSMASTSIGMHISGIDVGRYMTAHRHLADAYVMSIEGEGYSVLFMPGEEKNRRRVPFKPYAVIAPRHNEYHQFMNTGLGPMKYLAFRSQGLRYGWGKVYDPVGAAHHKDKHGVSVKLRYEDEDPEIRNEYYHELENRGIHLRLKPVDQGGD
jgi:mannose-6-phosphate isomerase-like protein (cupin superfamily)